MLCISRYTDDTYAQQFGDGRHKFYLEFRCNRPCLKHMDFCAKCAEKSPSTTLQYSRKFNHGNVNEPIPDNSHIYGGKWYYNGCQKWGAPPSEIIEFAIQYQKEARGDFIVSDYINSELYDNENKSITKEMPRGKKIETLNPDGTPVPIKKPRKPKVASAIETSDTTTPVKRTRKPKVAPIIASQDTHKKKIVETPYSTLINNTPQMVHKEISLPTHIENKLEEIDSEGFTIEYITLSVFDIGHTTYFRDISKNKLYAKIKEKGIGSYVGRWHPDTESIIFDIPDSDEE